MNAIHHRTAKDLTVRAIALACETLDIEAAAITGLKQRLGVGFGRAVALILRIFADGDLRRLIEQGVDVRTICAGEVMHASPKTISAQALAVEAAALMEANRITSVLVVDTQGRLCGALNSNDLLRAKVI